jgi:pentatricopeptide repeat protein
MYEIPEFMVKCEECLESYYLLNPLYFQLAKWMLSKGQGATMGTYDTLLLAFGMEQRVDEAESLWNMIIHAHTRSVSKRLFSRMISLYDHHNLPDKIVEVRYLYFYRNCRGAFGSIINLTMDLDSPQLENPQSSNTDCLIKHLKAHVLTWNFISDSKSRK